MNTILKTAAAFFLLMPLSCIEGGGSRDNNFNAVASNFIVSASRFVFNSDCEPISISILDDAFNSRAITTAVTLSVDNSSSTAQLYSNSGCTTGVTSISIPSGSTSQTFYVQNTASETVVLELLDEDQTLTNKATVSINFLQGIFFFSGGATTGNLGGVSGADQTCADQLADQYSESSPTIVAFLADSTTRDDLEADIAAPASKKVYSLTSRDEEIADSYALLFDTVSGPTPLEKSLKTKGVFSSPWWSGADPAGADVADNCSNWQTDADTSDGQNGSDDDVSSVWLQNSVESCDNENNLLCLVF
ncbi:MAG: DUF1554 domain-containing protein [Bdellovibrionales bacterium]|nr:DUF1554 domain-containing protein [Bdellovibrionales bacterium]